ncbi:TPA: hypothetical protein EYP44_01345 [Candidatus Bathyarchaeota archaeon]|nr:hypothetical protein [Candidatus Bathyarchaeota archaeon]
MAERPRDRIVLVYWLKGPRDLTNILSSNPGIPVFHYEAKEHVYVAHALGNVVFALRTEKEIPKEELIVPFKGDKTANVIEVDEIQAMSLRRFAEHLGPRRRARPP